MLAELREREGPVAWVDGLGAWMVLTRERALEVMRDDATFTVQDPRFTTGRVVIRTPLHFLSEEARGRGTEKQNQNNQHQAHAFHVEIDPRAPHGCEHGPLPVVGTAV